MDQKELEKIIEIAENQRRRAKKQNDEAKKRWETVSCRLPIGTKKRIEKTGFAVNGIINFAVLKLLESMENNGYSKEDVEKIFNKNK